MLADIIVPEGTRTVRFRDIPNLFATAIHPPIRLPAPRLVTELKKLPTTSENSEKWCGRGVRAFPVALTEDDFSALHARCWKELPTLSLPIEVDQWAKYLEAFRDSPPDGWVPVPLVVNPELDQKLSWLHTSDEYKLHSILAVSTGDLRVRSPSTLLPQSDATGEYLLECIVTVEDLATYAATLQFGVTCGLDQSRPASAHTSSSAASALDQTSTSAAIVDHFASPPGTPPRIAIGKLVIKAAWLIESDTGKKATDAQVMARLQKWADDGEEPAVLNKSNRSSRSITWTTSKSVEKEYTMAACQKTLEAWNKSRK